MYKKIIYYSAIGIGVLALSGCLDVGYNFTSQRNIKQDNTRMTRTCDLENKVENIILK